ncbi:unnamed protein product [Orchesella dallaii]|uniref:Peptidase M14 domain-containing protein n=1 Tax=Orchesella dallaii TaxID=48710 RepID=A0ABP1R0X1_9HEXA
MTYFLGIIPYVLCLSTILIQGCRANELTRVWWRSVSRNYLNYSEVTNLLHSMEAEFPTFIKVYSLGKSVRQLDIWAINIRENVYEERPLGIPQLKISANIHGDESVGRSLVLMLAVDLTRRYLAGNKTSIWLLTKADIHLIPSINPDGFEQILQEYSHGHQAICEPFLDKFGRLNARGKDLNSNFPDQFEEIVQNENTQNEKETKNIVEHIKTHDFVLSLNLMGGALVAAYGFMSGPLQHSRCVLGDNHSPSLSPDEKYFEWLSKLYATNHKTMGTGPQCETKNQLQFPLGISNGASSPHLSSYGSMSDFVYLNSNCFELTVFVSCCKFPDASSLHQEWLNNARALYKFLIAGSFVGIKGVFTDEQGQPNPRAKVVVEGNSHHVFTNLRGEYWRPLATGSYRYSIVSSSTQSSPITLEEVEDLPDPENEVIEEDEIDESGASIFTRNLTLLLVLMFLVTHFK